MLESDYLGDNMRFLEKLRQIPTLDAFPEEELKGVLRLSKIVKYDDGEQIIEEGHEDKRIFFLVSGKTRVAKHDEVLSYLKRTGDVFGEMGIIDGSPRSASVCAMGETVCLVADASQVGRLSGKDRLVFGYVLYRIFAEILANRLRITSKELIAAKEEIRRLKLYRA